eukprot:COSAG02_NODE_43619_length_373_cov_0.748175_1_plen_30_part_10
MAVKEETARRELAYSIQAVFRRCAIQPTLQ